MAINVSGLKVLNTDKLRTGFRAKHNLTIDKLIVDMSIVGVDKNILRLTTHDNTNIDLDLSSYYYTKDDIDDLFLVPLATEEKAGRIRIGTMEEVFDGYNDTVAVTPYKLQQLLYYYNGGAFIAGENLDPGDFVYIYQDLITGDLMMKKAIATSYETLCDGYTVDEVLLGEEGIMKFSGGKNDRLTLLVPHSWYYLSPKVPDPWVEVPDPLDTDYNPLQITRFPPTEAGTYRQVIGYAVSPTELMVELGPGEVILGDVFESLPSLVFIQGVEMTQSLQLEDYLIEGIDPESLSYRFTGLPEWISNTSVVFNHLSFTGIGDEVGYTYVDMEVTSGTSKQVVKLVLNVIKAPKVTFVSTPGGTIKTGEVKQIPYDPNFSLVANVVGDHDGYRYTFNGGGLAIDSGFQETPLLSYPIVTNDPLSEGLMTSTLRLWIITGYDSILSEPIYTEIDSQTVSYVLGDGLGEGDTDHIINATLLPYSTILSSSGPIVEYQDGGINVEIIPVGIQFDVIKLTLFPNDTPYYSEITSTRTDNTGAITNEKIDPETGIATADPGWRSTALTPVSSGDRIWSDGDIILYNSGVFVDSSLTGESVIPPGVTHIRATKSTSAPFTESVSFSGETLFPSLEEKGIGEFSLMIVSEDNGSVNYQRLVKWIVTEKDPEPPIAQGGLKLVQMSPSVILADLSLSGSIIQLPASGFNVFLPDFGDQLVDRVTWTHEIDDNGWNEIDIERFVGRAAEVTFEEPTDTIRQLAFWNKSSTDIGSIHAAPSRQRTTFYGYLDRVLVAIKQSDYFFTDAPVGPPSGSALGYFDASSESVHISVSDVPETGGIYLIDTSNTDLGRKWVIYTNTYDSSTLFNEVIIYLNGIEVAHYVNSTSFDIIDAQVSDYLTWGTLVGGNRIVNGENIDLPGRYEVVYVFKNSSVEIGTKSVIFDLYSEDPGIKDPEECCKGNLKTTGNQTKEGILTFEDSPVVPIATESNQAVNLGQVQSIIAGASVEIVFGTPSTTWTWPHGLNSKPMFDIIVGGKKVTANATYPDLNTVVITFKNPQSGSIISRSS